MVCALVALHFTPVARWVGGRSFGSVQLRGSRACYDDIGNSDDNANVDVVNDCNGHCYHNLKFSL